MRIPHQSRNGSRENVGRGLIRQRRQHRRHQVHLDQLALTGPLAFEERSLNSDGCVQPGDDVHQRNSRFCGARLGMTGHTHETARRLRDQIVAGEVTTAGGSEPADRAVHQTRVDLAQLLVPESELGHRSRPEVLDNHVTGFRQIEQLLARRFVFEVECVRLLVPVHGQEVRGVLAEPWRTPGPGVVTFTWAFDLDHLCAEIAEQHRCVGPGQHTAEVEDPEPVQRAGVVACHYASVTFEGLIGAVTKRSLRPSAGVPTTELPPDSTVQWAWLSW